MAEVNEQALFATLKKQIPINAIGEVEILDVEDRMQKPGALALPAKPFRTLHHRAYRQNRFCLRLNC